MYNTSDGGLGHVYTPRRLDNDLWYVENNSRLALKRTSIYSEQADLQCDEQDVTNAPLNGGEMVM